MSSAACSSINPSPDMNRGINPTIGPPPTLNHLGINRRRVTAQMLRAAYLVQLFNEVCGPDYFEDDIQNSEEPPPKVCSVHGGPVQDDTEMHTNVTTSCANSHYDSNLLICTPCLHEYLKGRMFPLGEGDIRHRYPASTVRCWAPGCLMPLSHSDIQTYADPEVFEIYDHLLCERALVRDEQVIRCAFPDCRCFTWIEEGTAKDLKRFKCPECCRETCRECNDLYETHYDRECPTRKKRFSTKTKLVEFASKVRIARKHKCPNCPMRYEKNGGCDHITCGGTMWDQHMFGGCSHEFCHRCKGEWEVEGHAPYCIYYYRPRHIRHIWRRLRR